MKKFFLAGVAALFLATGTTHISVKRAWGTNELEEAVRQAKHPADGIAEQFPDDIGRAAHCLATNVLERDRHPVIGLDPPQRPPKIAMAIGQSNLAQRGAGLRPEILAQQLGGSDHARFGNLVRLHVDADSIEACALVIAARPIQIHQRAGEPQNLRLALDQPLLFASLETTLDPVNKNPIALKFLARIMRKRNDPRNKFTAFVLIGQPDELGQHMLKQMIDFCDIII